MPTTQQVADVIAGLSSIGGARDALQRAGYHACIAANRITVDDEVFAQFVGMGIDPVAGAYPRWLVYPVAGAPGSFTVVGLESAATLSKVR